MSQRQQQQSTEVPKKEYQYHCAHCHEYFLHCFCGKDDEMRRTKLTYASIKDWLEGRQIVQYMICNDCGGHDSAHCSCPGGGVERIKKEALLKLQEISEQHKKRYAEYEKNLKSTNN
jgi:hypothetical protein